ncbi:MAG: hypothetical protein JWM71_891, partial [Solirubrobacteraceae bacterium]|nr:hypothetical protein [Solirubrobacteraceae bacterium]
CAPRPTPSKAPHSSGAALPRGRPCSNLARVSAVGVPPADAPSQSLRVRAARGTVISAAFVVVLNLLSLARGFVVAGFITRSDYGAWGVLGAIVGALTLLKDVGISDRFLQQQEEDQQAAFEKAFTLDLVMSLALMVVMLGAVAIYATALGAGRIFVPGLVVALIFPAAALRTPVWIFARRLDYVRQRSLSAIDPVVGFVVTVALAASGAGLWSLVIGTLAGAWATAVTAALVTPIRLRLRWDRGTAREYIGFSWPLLAASSSGLVLAQVTVIAGSAAVGLAGLGAITLANNITSYASQVDQFVGDTLYPAVCRVRDRADLLFESFVKSNRLAVMWGLPFGIGVALFASPFVHFVIGERWRPAVVLLQALGVATAINQIGFNWTVYYRAIGHTLPFAKVAALSIVVFCTTAVPLLFLDHLRGLAISVAFLAGTQMIVRVHYLRKLFPQFRMVRHTARAVVPSIPAVALVLLGRLLLPGHSGARALGELAAYAVLTLVATVILERRMLLEMLGYLRGRSLLGAPADGTPA